MVIVWCRACLSGCWRGVPASCEHFARRSLMRVWIREASEGVMWIVPGAELGGIVMSFVVFLVFVFGRGLVLLVWMGRSFPSGCGFPFSLLVTVQELCCINMSFFSQENQNHIS
jgi:hypothetical protein